LREEKLENEQKKSDEDREQARLRREDNDRELAKQQALRKVLEQELKEDCVKN
jgi:hypothetical protein